MGSGRCLKWWIAGLLVEGAVGGAQAQSVSELARNTLDTDPALAAAQAQRRAAEERVTQAEAAFGPSASLRLDRSVTRYHEGPSFDLRRFASGQASVQVTQPLLRTALWPALRTAEAQLRQSDAAVEQARADALQRLVEALFEMLKARDAVSLAEAQQISTAEQLASARRSYAIGTAAVTDVREAEAKADTVAAQWAGARFELEARRQVLEALAGLPVTRLMGRGVTWEGLPAVDPASVPQWVADALARNPQIAQAEEALAAAEAEVEKAAQGHRPTVDLTLSSTMAKDTGTSTTTFGRRADSSQVGVSIQVPLFASGATQSKVVEALALRDKGRSDADLARRNATIGVRQSFSALLSALSLARGLETAVHSQEAALRANRRGYEVGMKVNAEVLDAQSRLFEARRDLSRSRYEAWLQYVKLRAFAGRLDEGDMRQLEVALTVVDAAAPEGPRRRGNTP